MAELRILLDERRRAEQRQATERGGRAAFLEERRNGRGPWKAAH
jgi:hypothetical protein